MVINTIVGAVALSVLMWTTPVHHYIDRVVPGKDDKPITFIKDVKWDINQVPNHVTVTEDVMDLSYSIIETKAIKPCQGSCPEVAYRGGEIFFFTFEPGQSGTMYRTKDVPNMYRVHGKEWLWFNFQVKGY